METQQHVQWTYWAFFPHMKVHESMRYQVWAQHFGGLSGIYGCKARRHPHDGNFGAIEKKKSFQ